MLRAVFGMLALVLVSVWGEFVFGAGQDKQRPSSIVECPLGTGQFDACVDRIDGEMLGKYFCMITDISGLQGLRGQRRPFSRISEKESKFFLEINKDSSLPCSVLSSFFVGLPEGICRTKYKVVAKTDLIASPSYSPRMMADFISARGIFTIVKSGEFWGNYHHDEFHYIYEGKCEKVN